MHTPPPAPPWAPPGCCSCCLAPLAALARSGGGEHYTPAQPGGRRWGRDGAWSCCSCCSAHGPLPEADAPAAGPGAVGYFVWQRRLGATGSTQRALQQREAEPRTQVSSRDVQGWVNALQLTDPAFELLPRAGARGGSSPGAGGVVPAGPAPRAPLPLGRHLPAPRRAAAAARLPGRARCAHRRAGAGGADHRARAERRGSTACSCACGPRCATRTCPPASRTSPRGPLRAASPARGLHRGVDLRAAPGAPTRIGQDLYQGKCPNCGAPYRGGAATPASTATPS